MKTLLISTAFLTAPMVSSVSAQTSEALKRQIAEQNRQISTLESEISSLQSQLNLERRRQGKTALPTSTQAVAASSNHRSQRTHTVKSGDTFSSIARKNGISLASLIAANKGVSPNRIAINQKLVIPQVNHTAKTTVAEAKPAKRTQRQSPTADKYTVQQGDTFYGIAKKNNTSVSKLIAMNPNVKPTRLQPGHVLNLKSSQRVAQVQATTPKPRAKTPAKTQKTQYSRSTAKVTPKPTPTPRSSAYTPAPKPTPKPASTTTVKHSEPTNIARTATVTSVMTYGQFASRNRTTVAALNAMNGLDLPADEPMAVGSALYVPSR